MRLAVRRGDRAVLRVARARTLGLPARSLRSALARCAALLGSFCTFAEPVGALLGLVDRNEPARRGAVRGAASTAKAAAAARAIARPAARSARVASRGAEVGAPQPPRLPASVVMMMGILVRLAEAVAMVALVALVLGSFGLDLVLRKVKKRDPAGGQRSRGRWNIHTARIAVVRIVHIATRSKGGMDIFSSLAFRTASEENQDARTERTKIKGEKKKIKEKENENLCKEKNVDEGERGHEPQNSGIDTLCDLRCLH